MLVKSFPTPFLTRMRRLFLLSSLVLASGCTMDVARLHDLNPPATDFPSSLASEYQAYADSELEQGHRLSAEHYAGKGLRALKGETVEPEPVDTSLAEAGELTDARVQLMKILGSDVKNTAPQQAARAQLLFDCWQNALSRKHDQEQVSCADEFKSTFSQLQETVDPLLYAKSVSYTLNFAPGAKTPDEEGRALIQSVADKVATLHHYRVQVDAYVGRGSVQHALSQARLAAVRHALIKAGVNQHSIHVNKVGSAKAVILSGDTMPMDAKKVTITIKMHQARGAKS